MLTNLFAFKLKHVGETRPCTRRRRITQGRSVRDIPPSRAGVLELGPRSDAAIPVNDDHTTVALMCNNNEDAMSLLHVEIVVTSLLFGIDCYHDAT